MKIVLLALLGLFASATALARFDASVDVTTLSEADTLRLTLRTDSASITSNPDFEPLKKDFDVLSDQRSSQIQSFNGQVDALTTWTLVLKPKHTGTLQIPAITLSGESTRPIGITVKELDPQLRRAISQTVFFETTYTPKQVYVQSQIVVTRRLFYVNGAQLYGDMPNTPDIPGAMVKLLGESEHSTAVRDGRQYGMIEQRFAVFPERSGDLTIPAATVTGSVRLADSGMGRRIGVDVSSDTLKVSVLPIPAEYPRDAPWLPATDVELLEDWPGEPERGLATGTPSQRTLIVRADGNASSAIPPLSFTLPDSLKAYPEPAKLSETQTRSGVVGTRIESTSLVATQPGDVTLPEVHVTWWDTVNQRVRTAALPAHTITITGDPTSTPSAPKVAPTAKQALPAASHGLWQRRFGGDASVVGSDIWLSDEKHRVISVMPRGFFFPTRQAEIWTPAAFTGADLARRGSHYLQCYARLKPGATLEQARAEMRRIMSQLEQAYPDTNQRVSAGVELIRDQMVGSTGIALWVLLAAAGCVLLIACANIANLLLARAAMRQRELAVRTALGASRMRLLAQSITESLLLAALGAVAGLGVARLSLFALQALVPETLPVRDLAIDPRALLFTLLLTLLTGLLFGAAPGLAAARTDLHDTLKQGGRGGTGLRSARLRNVLVVAEMALAVLLLIGSGLLLRTLAHLQSIDPGFEPAHLLTLSTPLPRPRYEDAAKREQFFLRVLDQVRALPGVEAAGYTTNLPFTAIGNTSTYFVESQRDPAREKMQDALLRVVSNDFLQTLRARMREGRFFGDADGRETQPVVIINETFANAHWPGKSALGQRIKCPAGDNDQPWRTVVGVARDVQERGLEWNLKPAVYIPLPQGRTVWNIPQDLIVRTSGDPLRLAGPVRLAIAAVDPDEPLRFVRAMEEVTDRELASRRQQLTILGAFAALSLLLASIGIYGVLAYVVSLRRKEIGIRIALGATGGSVVRSVVKRGMGLALGGVVVGVGGAFALTRAMRSLLNGVQAADPATFAAGSIALLIVALLACWLPARRAGGLNPVEALREE